MMMMMRPRSLLVALLVACGGANKPAPQNDISNTAVPSAPERAERPGPDPGSGGDRDGDGVVDSTDMCPDDPEDYDGFGDEDGCPDPDNEADGVLDVDDLCPNNAEDRDGDQDEDGCPE